MTILRQDGLLPRLRPLSEKRSSVVSVLDIGTSKICCLIGNLAPRSENELVLGRSHKVEIRGIGHQRSRGIKSGVIVNLEQAEQCCPAYQFGTGCSHQMVKVVCVLTKTFLCSARPVEIGQRDPANIQRAPAHWPGAEHFR